MINQPLKICIVGGGFGGLYAALYLSKFPQVKSNQWQIILIEPREHFLFTPLLYELITGELQRWAIAPSYRQLLSGTNLQFCQEKVKKVDLKVRQIYLENGHNLSYDYLVLGVGNQNRWSNIPGLSDHALAFRTLEDVENLQTRLYLLEASEKESYQIAVVGSGPNGVELSCKLADRIGKRGRVHLIERGQEILKHFSPSVRPASYRSLLKRQVEIHLGAEVQSIGVDRLTIYENNQRQTLPIDLVIWTAGTEAREMVRHLDCQQTETGKLLVRPTLQLLDYPEVFALGDIAEIYPYKKTIPATAQAAYQQASCLAKNIPALIRGKRLKSFQYLHLGDMLTLGKREGLISSFGINLEGRLADIARRFVYILRLPTLGHRSKVLESWMTNTVLKFSHWLRRQVGELFSPKIVPYIPRIKKN